ncbi:MAG: RNA methyltransferase [Saprospiraceae bacterium]|nr:RNA methyltransferase [Saprospiraceae bacterium]MDW8230585.1 RNA methyltransferase [Saprospiraceae bacterium]
MLEKRLPADLGRLSVEALKTSEKLPLVLVLDDIRSALNVGSVFRTADAFAVERLVLCGITACPPHREIHKTALGSVETVAWSYSPKAAQALQQLRSEGYRVLAIEQVKTSLALQAFVPELGVRYAFVLGNEISGVSQGALEHCDGALEIPQFGAKHSLNVAVAAGIAVWEFVRKHRLSGQ